MALSRLAIMFGTQNCAWLGLLAFAIWSGDATAQPVTSIPSCYVPLNIAPPSSKPAIELFVLMDQTVVFDQEIAKQIDQSVLQFVRPGNAFDIFQFSAFNQGRYMEIVAKGFVEGRLDQDRRNATGSDSLRRLDGCLNGQLNYAGRLAQFAIGKAISGASRDLAKSDIIGSLQAISRVVKSSTAARKIVIIGSDMLENSAVTSFYRRNGVRRIAPNLEIAKVDSDKMLGDFGEADVYVIGAGILPPEGDGKDAETQGSSLEYRDPLTMAALKQFWVLYFEKSNARLLDFGEPELLSSPK